MKQIPFLLTFLACLGLVRMLPGQGSNAPFGQQGFEVAVLGQGQIVVGGEVRAKEDFAPDVLLNVLDRCGNSGQVMRHGAAKQDGAYGLLSTRDGGLLVVGYTYEPQFGRGRHDFYLLKFDGDLQLEWSQLWGGPFRDMAFAAVELEDGYAVAGYTRSFGALGEFALARFDQEGQFMWVQSYGDTYTDYAHDLVETPTGFLLVGTAGGFDSPTQSNHHNPHADLMLIATDGFGNEVDRRRYGGLRHDFGERVQAAPDGGYWVLGSTQSLGAGSFDMWLLRLDDDLDTLWTQTLGGEGFEYGADLEVDAAGALYVAGTSASGGDAIPKAVVHHLDADGSLLWTLELGDDRPTYGQGIALHPQGGVVLTGAVELPDGNQELLTGRLWEDGGVGFLRQTPLEALVVPNPVTDRSRVVPGGELGCGEFLWRVYDVEGRLVLERESDGTGRMEVERGELRPGVYLFEVWAGEVPAGKGRFVVY